MIEMTDEVTMWSLGLKDCFLLNGEPFKIIGFKTKRLPRAGKTRIMITVNIETGKEAWFTSWNNFLVEKLLTTE